ncbi:DUF6746 family protein [Arhodomonas sp. SL1]|uniref:DUF6746 family protein n=1 Tax=Arhodomonas sp. SL1 TaxID=3425691 RepID=UPI003F880AC7
MKPIMNLALLAGLVCSAAAYGDEQPEHFEGKPSETLEEALTNLGEYNERLAAILEKGEISTEDHARIHELTYTLENALARIDEEVGEMAEDLEEVHLASERLDGDTVSEKGEAYLSAARKLTR